MEENNVPAYRRTNSTFSLNIASGFQAIAAPCGNPRMTQPRVIALHNSD
jgi:hypothetical protein